MDLGLKCKSLQPLGVMWHKAALWALFVLLRHLERPEGRHCASHLCLLEPRLSTERVDRRTGHCANHRAFQGRDLCHRCSSGVVSLASILVLFNCDSPQRSAFPHSWQA